MARVLVIEDLEMVRKIVLRTLTGENHEVVEAATAQAGIEAALRLAIDLVIVDVTLGGNQDGVDAMVAIRRSRPGIPLIVISGRAREDIETRVADAGIAPPVRVLTKPLRPEQVLGLVREALLG